MHFNSPVQEAETTTKSQNITLTEANGGLSS